MNGGGVKRVGGIADAEETGGLLEGFFAEAGDFPELGAGGEAAVRGAVADHVFRERGAEAGDVGEEVLGGGVQLDADGIHAALDGVIERGFQSALIDIVLVLADADGLGVDLHQFRERIHEAASDRNGAAHGDILVGEFLASGLGGGIDRGAALVHHDDLDGGGQLEFFDKGLGLAGGGAVADRDGLDVVLFDEGAQFDGGFVGLVL